MNAPVLTAMPAAIQREHAEALQWFRATHAKYLSFMQNAGIGPFIYATPDRLEWEGDNYDLPFWRAVTEVDGREIEGHGESAKVALETMMRLAEKHVEEEARLRMEDA